MKASQSITRTDTLPHLPPPFAPIPGHDAPPTPPPWRVVTTGPYLLVTLTCIWLVPLLPRGQTGTTATRPEIKIAICEKNSSYKNSNMLKE